MYITLEGEEVWNGFELTLSKNGSSPGMTGKLIPGGELISPSFRQCDKRDHTGSQSFWKNWASWMLSVAGPPWPCNFENLRFEPRSGLLVFVGALRSGASLSVEILGNG